MGRRKKIIELGSKEKPYCGNRDCKDMECIRHDRLIPFYKLVWREDFNKGNKDICKDKIIESD